MNDFADKYSGDQSSWRDFNVDSFSDILFLNSLLREKLCMALIRYIALKKPRKLLISIQV